MNDKLRTNFNKCYCSFASVPVQRGEIFVYQTLSISLPSAVPAITVSAIYGKHTANAVQDSGSPGRFRNFVRRASLIVVHRSSTRTCAKRLTGNAGQNQHVCCLNGLIQLCEVSFIAFLIEIPTKLLI